MLSAGAKIHLEVIRKNIRYLMTRIDPSTKFMGVIKADAHGHGVLQVARILEEEGASHFAVALIQEGAELRENGFQQPILLLGHTFDEDYPLVQEYSLMSSISTFKGAESLNYFSARMNSKFI